MNLTLDHQERQAVARGVAEITARFPNLTVARLACAAQLSPERAQWLLEEAELHGFVRPQGDRAREGWSAVGDGARLAAERSSPYTRALGDPSALREARCMPGVKNTE